MCIDLTVYETNNYSLLSQFSLTSSLAFYSSHFDIGLLFLFSPRSIQWSCYYLPYYKPPTVFTQGRPSHTVFATFQLVFCDDFMVANLIFFYLLCTPPTLPAHSNFALPQVLLICQVNAYHISFNSSLSFGDCHVSVPHTIQSLYTFALRFCFTYFF